MRKLFSIAIAIALLFSCASVWASVGYQKDGENSGTASKINIERGWTDFDGSTLTIYANGYAGGVTSNVSTESNLTSAALAYGFIRIAGGGPAKYLTLADGEAGQMLTIQMVARDGANVVIGNYGPTMGTKTGWSTITFDTALDSVTLLYLDSTSGWIVVGNSGTTIA